MPRKSPTTGAKPNRDDGQSYVAEEIWHWIKEHRNTILLVLTILVAGTVLFIMRTRATSAKHKRAHQAIGQVVTGMNQSDQKPEERIKRIKSKLAKYSEFEDLAPWFRLHLADAYYMDQRYEQAITTLKELRSKHPNSPAADQAQLFLERIRGEQSFVQKELKERTQELQQKFSQEKRVFGISDEEISSTSKTPETSKQQTE